MKRGWRLAVSVLLGVAVAAAVSSRARAEEQRDVSLYIGTKVCGMCHKKDESGNQLAKWKEGPHAKAFEVLGTDKAKEPAAKKGVTDPQHSPKCLKCHSTAYNWTEEVQTQKVAVEDGVTCESCHGPGKKYMIKETMKSREKSIAAGMIYPATKSCPSCHNDQNPTYKPDRYTTKDGKKVDFDVDQAAEKIKHPNPKVQK